MTLGPAAAALGTVLATRELRRVQLAFLTFNAAEWGTWIAMLVYAYGKGGATTAGVVALAQLVPAAVYAPFAARIADRLPAGRVLAAAYAVMALTLAAVAVALVADADPVVVYVLGALPGAGLTLVRPCQATLMPALARSPTDLTASNVVGGWIESVTVLVAPAATGLLLDVSGPGAVFLVAAAITAVGAALVLPLPSPPPAPASDEPAPGVLAVVRGAPAARLLLGLLTLEFVAIGALDVLYPELAVAVLDRSEGWAGYLNAALGLGGVLGIGATALLVGRRRLAPALGLGLVLWCAAFVVLAALPTTGSALALLTVAGMGRVVVDVAGRTLLQRVAPTNLLASVFGVLEGLTMAGLALGSILAPALVALGGAELALVCVGALLPLGAVLAGRRLFAIDAHATVPVVEITLLRSLPVFAPLGPATLESLARALEPLSVPAGTAVVTQGEQGDRFYVVADGAVEVVRDGALVATLGRGEGFGEIALLRDVPRTATCRATAPTSLYALEKGAFLEAVTGHPSAHAEARRLADAIVPAR